MKSSFAKILSSLRREKGLSQRRAATDLGVSQALLSHYENDAREPKLEFVIKACDYYNVSADYLLGRSGDWAAPTLLIPNDCDAATRFASTTGAVFDMLDKLSDQELYTATMDFLAIPMETAAALLRDPESLYDPIRDAELKMAESALLKHAQRAATGPDAIDHG